MNDRRTNPSDPTAERTSEQSTPSASGLTGGRPEDVRRTDETDDLTPRGAEDDRATPRQRDSDEDTVMPTDDSSLGTKI